MALPTFRTPRLRIRPRLPADTDACLAMDREPGVTRFIDGPWNDPEIHRAFVEARTRGPYPSGLGYWTILDDDRFAGWLLLIPADGKGPDVEIGWRLKPRSWGKGYATEAARPLLRHGFVDLGLPEIVADIDIHNGASRRVAEKLGLNLRDERRTPTRRVACYAISRDEFLSAADDT